MTTSERRMTLILFKSRLWHGCFPMNFVKVLRTSFLEITSGRLLLSFVQVWPNVGLGAIVLQFLKNSSSVFFKGLRVEVWAVGFCYAILLVLHWVGVGHWPVIGWVVGALSRPGVSVVPVSPGLCGIWACCRVLPVWGGGGGRWGWFLLRLCVFVGLGARAFAFRGLSCW